MPQEFTGSRGTDAEYLNSFQHCSTEGHLALSTQVNQWLRDAPSVLAFSSAQARDGGMGAMYVLLRRLS